MNVIASKPSLIEYKHLTFLIMDCPKEDNIHMYLKECKKHNVVDIVRIAEPCYDKDVVEAAGITLHDMQFEDGASPEEEIIDRWTAVVKKTFKRKDKPCIAVHCVAGLGRAPVLVAIALIQNGMDSVSAVTLIREKRRGAINAVQLAYLEEYQEQTSKKKCVIM